MPIEDIDLVKLHPEYNDRANLALNQIQESINRDLAQLRERIAETDGIDLYLSGAEMYVDDCKRLVDKVRQVWKV